MHRPSRPFDSQTFTYILIPPSKSEVDGIEKEWIYQKDSFDSVHAWNLAQTISIWSKLIDEIFRQAFSLFTTAAPTPLLA
jgi:hypothetical protein